MSIYLGTKGLLKLRRTTSDSYTGTVNASDVNTTKKRFSFDFTHGDLITGDQVEFTSTDGTVLDFVVAAGWSNTTQQTSGKWFLNVDDLDGIRLYDTFAKSINGGSANAIATATPGASAPIKYKVTNVLHRIIGQVSSYELNTNRETVDITVLGDAQREMYSGLISGNGRIECFWDYRDTVGSNEYEIPHYLAELMLRTRAGSEFEAEFFIKNAGYTPSGATGTVDDMVWYDIKGLLTGCAFAFQTNNLVKLTANFVTTGSIELKVATEADFDMTQEDTGDILLEQDSDSRLAISDS